MSKNTEFQEKFADLRRRAEKMLTGEKADNHPENLARLIHELEVHQIELEIQNEELRRAQRELQDSRNQYLDLYDLAPVGYVTLNKKGLIIQANLTAAALLGVERARLIQQSITHFMAPESQDTLYFHLEKLRKTGHKQNCEVRMRQQNGATFWGHLEFALVGQEARVGITDITASKQAEEKIEKLNKFLIQRTEDLETANKELEGFSFSISQDLKTPLRHSESFSQALLEKYAAKLDEEGQDYLRRIRGNSQLASRYLDDLRLLSAATTHELTRSTVNLSEMAQQAALALKNSAPEREVELVIEPGLKASGDISLLRMVIENLMDNAFKFTGKVSPARIEFGTTWRDGKEAYFVKDNGAGFDMVYADKLFAPFRRLHADKTYPGTGIGLAIVQRIIHRHSGRVWAESQKDQGATFYFTLGE